MKKIYTLIAAVALTIVVNAQNRALMPVAHDVHSTPINVHSHLLSNTNRANGDTLMWLPLPGAYVADSTNNYHFKISNEDVDGLPTNNAGYVMAFGIYYSTDTSGLAVGHPWGANYYHTYENPVLAGGTDSTFFWHATSWFNPAGTANNWLNFGPITVPAGGASIKWYDKTNPSYRDGYTVYVTSSTASPDSATFTDFNDPSIWSRPDSYPSVTAATDTNWSLRTVTLPASYTGQTVWFGFNHNAHDMDVLYLDDFTVIAGPLGIAENEFVNGVKLGQNSPNPFNTFSTINYELASKSLVVLSIYDVTGKKVAEQAEGNQTAGTHTLKVNASNLSAGVYYYALQVGDNTSSAKKMVIVK
jgi:Secretion system C-terminal sorting domain